MLKTSIVLAVQRTAHATAQAVAVEGLSPAEANTVANLREPRTVTALATDAGVRPTTMTNLLDRLESRGLVTRSPSPRDRRSSLVELTPDGQEVAARVLEAIDDLERRALSSVDSGARRDVIRTLAALTEEAR